LSSGAKAAAAGGVTAVMCMPNTVPTIDTPELVRDIITRSKGLPVKIYPCAAITKGLNGKELTDFAALKAEGAVAVSDDGMPVADSRLMADAMLKAHEAGLAIISHCEDLSIAVQCSRASENSITAREVELAKELNVPIHIAHVSTKEAIEYISDAKCRNPKITYEVTPHHFTFTKKDIADSDYKMNPPLREIDDVLWIIDALDCYGQVDCIASDHAPHTPSEKAGENPPNGVLGLETILAVTLTRLYHEKSIPLNQIVEMLCVNPREILGIEGGSIKAGSPADIAVVDLNEEWIVDPSRLQSKSKNTCFKGMKLKGKVKYTLLDGIVVYEGL
jgi:dihydroorotase